MKQKYEYKAEKFDAKWAQFRDAINAKGRNIKHHLKLQKSAPETAGSSDKAAGSSDKAADVSDQEYDP